MIAYPASQQAIAKQSLPAHNMFGFNKDKKSPGKGDVTVESDNQQTTSKEADSSGGFFARLKNGLSKKRLIIKTMKTLTKLKSLSLS